MSTKEILDTARINMQKSFEHYSSQITKVRTGRATASILDDVNVEYYGSPTQLSQTANISVPDARSIVINPYDKSILSNIEKAIQQADLGFNPQNDGNIIRINVPPLTEERRKDFVKLTKKYAEDGKVAIRNLRRDYMESFKKAEKAKEISEDEKKKGEELLQKATDEFIGKIDKVVSDKEKELLDN